MFRGKLLKRGLYSDISVMMSGTLLAQLLIVGVTPLLTRLYEASDFGLLSIFISALQILAVGTTGKYEMAIVIPRKTETTSKLIHGMLLINHFFVIFFFFIFFFFYDRIIALFGWEELSYYVFLLPICILIVSYNTAFNHWFLRHRKYYISSIIVLFSAIVISSINLIIGYFKFLSNGLIFAYVTAQASVFFMYLYQLKKNNLHKPLLVFASIKEIRLVLREYINFPKFQLPSELLFTTATQITPIVFAFLFTTAVVGHFALALRLVKVPLIILSNAINNVFKNEAIDRYRDKGNCKDLFISLFKKLFLIAIVPFTILFFAAPDLFSLVLGESWRNAGNYAQILIFGLLFELLAFPFRSIFQITNTQFIYLRLQFLSLLLILVAVGLGYYLYNDPWFAVLFYSVAIAISHLVSIVCIYFLAKGNYAKIRIDNA